MFGEKLPEHRTLTVGVDLDDTIINTRTTFLSILNRVHRTAHAIEDLPDYSLHIPFGIGVPEILDLFTRHQDAIHQSVEAFPGACEVLRKLARTCHLVVLTARPPEHMDAAKRWVERQNIGVRAVVSSHGYESKASYAVAQGFSMFVEDNPSHAIPLAEAGVKVLLYRQPYNLECVHRHIVPVTDWATIDKSIRGVATASR